LPTFYVNRITSFVWTFDSLTVQRGERSAF
jgi:hypothetical protein